MKHLLLQIRRFILSFFMKGGDEPTHLKEVDVQWTCGHGYGNYHPDKLWQWWYQGDDDDLIQGDMIGYRYEPKLILGDYADYRKGVRRSTTLFTRGFFHFDVIRSKSAGGAIWLTGADSWPPEIDIVEWYGKRTESNFHISDGEGVKAHRHSPARTYSCWWEKGFVRIYYDGFLVREYKNDYFEDRMQIIINTGCHRDNLVSHTMSATPKIYQ